MSSNILHEASALLLDSLAVDLPQSLILAGPVGVGLTGAADYILKDLKVTRHIVLPEKNEKIDLESGVISVDSIRRLYELTKTIETGKRVIVIDYAERMASQAQNAFLKLLEEPGVNTHFILLTHEPSRLLPTIQSRAQRVDIRPISKTQSVELLTTLGVTDTKRQAQLLFVAMGLPAELTRLSKDESYFEKRAAIIRDARQLLQGSTYERLRVAEQYKDNRQAALTVLLDAMNMLRSSLSTDPKQGTLTKMRALLRAYERIEANGHIRLQLSVAVL